MMRGKLLVSACTVFLCILIPFSANAEVNSKTEMLRDIQERLVTAERDKDAAEKAVADAQQSGNQQQSQFAQQALEAAKELVSSLMKQLQQAQAPLMDADAMCTPVKKECGCGKIKICDLGGCKCVRGPNMWQCPCFQNIPNTDHVVTGICVESFNCEGESFTNLEGQTQDVGGLGGVIGKIFEGALGQLGNLLGGGGGADGGLGTGGTVDGKGSGGRDGGDERDGGRNTCSLTNRILGKCGSDGTKCPIVPAVDCQQGFKPVSGGRDTNGCPKKDTCEPVTTAPTSQGTFTATPRSGEAPLMTSFTTNYGDTTDTRPSFADGKDTILDFGDGSTPMWIQCTNKQGSSGTCAISKTISHTYAKNGTYTAVVKKTGGLCAGSSCPETTLKAVTISVSSDSVEENERTFKGAPQSGRAPLAVTFTYTNPREAGECERTVAVNHGDGTTYAPGEDCFTEHRHSHVYDTPGSYTAILEDASFCTGTTSQNCTRPTLARVSITVTEAQVQQQRTQTQSTQINQDLYTQVVQAQPNQAAQYSGTLPSGTQGDIQVTGSGATVFGGSRDITSDTEVAGFYGADAFGGASQGVVARLCQARPWAESVVSYVIPPTFFDGLCTWRGYSITAPSTPTVLPRATIVPQQQPVQSVTSTPSGPFIEPKVDIWASPARVPLGGRTSVFWTTKGVASCSISSSAGNFSENTLSGGAATVPITGLTVFKISCTTPTGTTVEDTTEVDLTI